MTKHSPSFSKFTSRPRKAVRVTQEELVRSRALDPADDNFLLLIEPNLDNVSLGAWAASHQEFINKNLLKYGALLFRGFDVASPEQFRSTAGEICPNLLDYTERAAPRHEVSKNVYTSTEFPADQIIPLHHEMSYSHNWPTRILFYCDKPPTSGGRTPVANDREVIQLIDPDVKERFLRHGVMYVRNYGEGVDLSWKEAFQADDRGQVEAYCRRAGMDVEWREGDRLRTRGVRQVLATHPETGEIVWFNHAHLFHMSNLQPEVREALLSEFEPEELPRNAFYGDGSPIDDQDLMHIRDVYEQNARRFEWSEGDVLLVDNFLVSHGREAYAGPRKILVAMADLFTNRE